MAVSQRYPSLAQGLRHRENLAAVLDACLDADLSKEADGAAVERSARVNGRAGAGGHARC
jgi:hypothetical protein